MKKLFLSMLMIVSVGYLSTALSQGKAYIKFDKTVHDYGKIKESDGKADCVFTFVNTGTEPLIITNVKPNCGCTASEYTMEPVAPNGKGFVKASYDPSNRPGAFNKTIRVTSNAENSNLVLTINGEVTPKELKVEDNFPHEMKGIRLSTNHVAFQNLGNKEIKRDTVKIISISEEPVKISFKDVPKHMTITAIPETLKPNQNGIIIVNYDASKKDDWGFVIDRVAVVFNDNFDPKDRDSRITISANIQEDFSALTPDQLAKAPKIDFVTKSFDFGTINQGESVTYEYKFKNTGKSDLLIRKTKASCGCTVVDQGDKVVAPGAESKFTATFNSRGKKGKQNKTITVITNDPENQSIVLKITGTVNVPEQK